MRTHSSHHLVGGLAHAAAASVLLVILLLGALRPAPDDRVSRAVQECGCGGLPCQILGTCGEADR